MFFTKNESPKQKKKSATPTLVLWGLASVGAYSVVSAVKKKTCCMINGMKSWMKEKSDHKNNAEFL